jgi:Glyoxalase superfamily protein
MTDSKPTAAIAALKTQAKRLREHLQSKGVQTSHSEALEMIAHQNGARDWNTLRASTGNKPPVPRIGERVTGRYLGQRFSGEVRGITRTGPGDQYRVTLHFDEPVDVVTFDSFSSFRQRVSTLINGDGVSPRKTSDGMAQLIIDRPEA